MLRFINKPLSAQSNIPPPPAPNAAPVHVKHINGMTDEMTDSEVLYYNSLNDIEKMAMVIAKDHLSTSFCLSKTIGYKTFISNMG
jgi:hypothetical protein